MTASTASRLTHTPPAKPNNKSTTATDQSTEAKAANNQDQATKEVLANMERLKQFYADLMGHI